MAEGQEDSVYPLLRRRSAGSFRRILSLRQFRFLFYGVLQRGERRGEVCRPEQFYLDL